MQSFKEQRAMNVKYRFTKGEVIIRQCFDFGYYTKNVDSIFKRVFGE